MDKRLDLVAFSAQAEFSAPDEKTGERRFAGVAYAGGVITDHGWYDRVAFDLASTKFATPAPVLLEHGQPIGVTDKATINGSIKVEGRIFADVEGPASGVAKMADRGMPWQMSVYIKPGRVEEIKAGDKVDINGQTIDGPLTVFRNSRVREVSFCALGADDKTNAHVFNAHPSSQEPPEMETVSKAEHDRIVGELNTKITGHETTIRELQDKFSAHEKAKRLEAVKSLFKDTGREFKDDVAKPYLEMSEEAFSAVAADLRAAKPKADPSLLEGVGEGRGDPDNADAQDIAKRASTYRAEQKKLGFNVSASDAVAHVTNKFKAKAAA